MTERNQTERYDNRKHFSRRPTRTLGKSNYQESSRIRNPDLTKTFGEETTPEYQSPTGQLFLILCASALDLLRYRKSPEARS